MSYSSTNNKVVLSVSLLWLGHFLVDFLLGIWPVYKTIAGLDLALAGLIAATCAFIGEGMQIVFGSLGDRGLRKRLILFGVIFTGANALLPLTQNYFLLFGLLLLTCLGSGAFHPSAVAFIGGLTNQRKALFVAIFSSGGSLGMGLSQICFSNFYGKGEGQVIFILLPSILLACLLLFLGYVNRETESKVKLERPGLGKFKEFFQHPQLRLLYFNQVCNQTIAWGAIFLLPDVLISRGYGESMAYGIGHLAFILGGTLMMVPSGYLADKYSSKTVITFATLTGMVLFYTFLFVPLISTSLLILLLLGMGAAIGIVQPVAVAFGNQLCRSHPSMVSAFLMGLVWCVSETVGPAGGGLLTKLFTEDAPAKALSVLGLLFFVNLIVLAKLPKNVPEESLSVEKALNKEPQFEFLLENNSNSV